MSTTKLKTITFTEDVIYETEGRKKGEVFKSGTTHELREDLADRWIRRDVAFEGKPAAPGRKPQPKQQPAGARTPDAAKVVIPETYTKLSPQELLALAAKVSTAEPRNPAEALDIVEAELEIRGQK